LTASTVQAYVERVLGLWRADSCSKRNRLSKGLEKRFLLESYIKNEHDLLWLTPTVMNSISVTAN